MPCPLPAFVVYKTLKSSCTFLGDREEEWPQPDLPAALGECRARGPFCTPGSLSVLGTLLPASAPGRLIASASQECAIPQSWWHEGLQRPCPIPVPAPWHSLKE